MEKLISVRKGNFTLYYYIYNYEKFDAIKGRYPVLVVGGGPGLLHNYLLALLNLESQCFVFYDQVGSGKSDKPDNPIHYSIDLCSNDLGELIDYLLLQFGKVHLLGHSFGGIVVYNYLKSQVMDQTIEIPILSCTLLSSPTSMPLLEREILRLRQAIMTDKIQTTVPKATIPRSLGPLKNEVDEMFFEIDKIFLSKHVCRSDVNLSLYQDNTSPDCWRGMQAIGIRGWSAENKLSFKNNASSWFSNVNLYIIRGEFDFVTDICISKWNLIHSNSIVVEAPPVPNGGSCDCKVYTVENSSHYSMLENINRLNCILCDIWNKV